MRAGEHLVHHHRRLAKVSAVEEDLSAGACLLYTSDAADERSSVDLGGRRIIKKKTSTRPTLQAQHTTRHKGDNATDNEMPKGAM